LEIAPLERDEAKSYELKFTLLDKFGAKSAAYTMKVFVLRKISLNLSPVLPISQPSKP
jgi:hypothetical protein